MLIKITSGSDKLDNILFRQLPNNHSHWNGIEFVPDSHIGPVDWWVVCHPEALKKEVQSEIIRQGTVLISMEPADWGLSSRFCEQFDIVLSTDTRIRHKKLIPLSGHSWWVGLNAEFGEEHKINRSYNFGFDFLERHECSEKRNRASVITSSKVQMAGHVKRMKFIDGLVKLDKENLIDFYGGGVNPIADKWEGLREYKYHIALENSQEIGYWTEKLADPLLAWCYTLYNGCPNIDRFFPDNGITSICLDKPQEAYDELLRCLEEDRHYKSMDGLRKARGLVLRRYNIFNIIAVICVLNTDKRRTEHSRALKSYRYSGRVLSGLSKRKVVSRAYESLWGIVRG